MLYNMILISHYVILYYIIQVLVTINLGLLNLILTVIVDRAQQAHLEDTKLVLQQRKDIYIYIYIYDICVYT